MEAGAVLVVVGIVLMMAVILAKAVVLVMPGNVGIVERLGRYQRKLQPGLALIVPFVDQVRQMPADVDQSVSFHPKDLRTSDNHVVQLEVRVGYRVVDPVSVRYQVADLRAALEQTVSVAAQVAVGERDLEGALVARAELRDRLEQALTNATTTWGVTIDQVEVTGPTPDRRPAS